MKLRAKGQVVQGSDQAQVQTGGQINDRLTVLTYQTRDEIVDIQLGRNCIGQLLLLAGLMDDLSFGAFVELDNGDIETVWTNSKLQRARTRLGKYSLAVNDSPFDREIEFGERANALVGTIDNYFKDIPEVVPSATEAAIVAIASPEKITPLAID